MRYKLFRCCLATFTARSSEIYQHFSRRLKFEMLWRIFVIAAACLHSASAGDPDVQSEDFMGLFAPEDLIQFTSELNEEDIQVLIRMSEEDPSVDFKPVKELVNTLRQNSTTLAEKMKKAADAIHKKIMQLEPESQTFAKELLEDSYKFTLNEPVWKQRKEMLLHFINKYAAMSAKAKEDFGRKFPRLAASFSDPFLKMAIAALN
ncbi:hypothetical protein OESDEN_00911 [Oesophagostomum dentatum]|uniref:Nematode fatty acid retinoid binding protein n=1 Tax=Oesophagostomum dentatum TaxID=61180 RepID=A0A0B1TTC6_OESDE|nr:hypothetical protein OESDEN_00911 [Oesophagostomum dentatum]